MLHQTDELMRDFVIRDMQVVVGVYRIMRRGYEKSSI